MSTPISLEDAWRRNPVEIDHEVIDFGSAQEVPASYEWTSDGIAVHHPPPSGDGKSPVPVVDLAAANAAEQLDQACRTWGAFLLVNHGVPEAIMDGVIATAQTLFALPLEPKLSVARPADELAGYGQHRLAAFYPQHSWCEGFSILGTPDHHFRRLWPQDHTRFSDAVENFEKEMNQLAERLLCSLLCSLGITEDDWEWASLKKGVKEVTPVVQFNSYPSCPDPVRAMGLGAHSDSSLFTFLCQNRAGLQVLKEGLGWFTVPAIPHALVVQIGDLFDILSNGLYKGVIHRVAVDQAVDRLSVGYFLGTPKHVKLEPLKKLVSLTQPALYRPINWGEFLELKHKHFNKTMSLIRVRPDGIA